MKVETEMELNWLKTKNCFTLKREQQKQSCWEKKSINMRKQSEKKTSTKNLTHHYYYYYYHFHFSFVSYFMLVLLLRMIFCRLGVWWFALCTCILYVGSIRLSNGPKNILIHTLHTRIKPAKLDIHFIFYGCFIFRFVNLTYFNPFSSFASFRPKCIQEKSYFPWKFITFCVLSFGCVIIPNTTLSMNNTPCSIVMKISRDSSNALAYVLQFQIPPFCIILHSN